MLLGPGVHVLRRRSDTNVPFLLDWASVSATAPSSLVVVVGAKVVETVFVGPYSPHTWWASNPIIGPREAPEPGQVVAIHVGPDAMSRIESNLELEGAS